MADSKENIPLQQLPSQPPPGNERAQQPGDASTTLSPEVQNPPVQPPPAYSNIPQPQSKPPPQQPLVFNAKVAPLDMKDPPPAKWSRNWWIGRRVIGFPFATLFIIGMEFCERFSYYGMKAILVIYFRTLAPSGLGMNDDTATTVYHAFSMLCYFTPLLGGIIADTWLGKFWTIVILSIVYCIGNVVMSVSSFPFPAVLWASVIGLLLIALGTGGIKPCVSSFGADQFTKSESDQKAVSRFFSAFYFAINFGSLISMFLTPILRADVHCFDGENCYPLAFGVPAGLMIVALAVFVLGAPLYKKNPPAGNVLVRVSSCIYNGFKHYFARPKGEKGKILDYATKDPRFDSKFVGEVRTVLGVLLLFLPVPIYWALNDQQGSRWTIQATYMDYGIAGDVTMHPDQMQLINPLFVLILIPIFESIIYPLLGKCNILTNKRLPHRMVVGGIFAGLAFVVAAILQIAINPTQPAIIEGGKTRVFVSNLAQDCKILTSDGTSPYEFLNTLPSIDVNADQEYRFLLKLQCTNFNGPEGTLTIPPIAKENSPTYMPTTSLASITTLSVTLAKEVLKGGNEVRLVLGHRLTGNNRYFDFNLLTIARNKADNGDSFLRFITVLNEQSTTENYTVLVRKTDGQLARRGTFGVPSIPLGASSYVAIERSNYRIHLRRTITSQEVQAVGEIGIKNGAAITYVLYRGPTDEIDVLRQFDLYDMPANSVSILLQLPQYFLITLAEVLFSIAGLEFAYQQAPPSMKAILTAGWQLTVAFGNAIVLIIAQLRAFDQVGEFFLYAGLMFIDVLIFAVIAFFYKYADYSETEPEPVVIEKEREAQGGQLNASQAQSQQFTVGGQANPGFAQEERKQ